MSFTYGGKTYDVFVFGSNRAGIHGRGSALHARRFCGAWQGVGSGRMGSSYAIPTKDARIRTIPLSEIREGVEQFLDYARNLPGTSFYVVAIGCGLAGYSPDDIAPMFIDHPPNVHLAYELDAVLSRMRADAELNNG